MIDLQEEEGFASQPDVAYRVESIEDVSHDNLDISKKYLSQMVSGDPNALYQKCFQVLKQGGLAAEIPRMVVFGQQSMGKTTLLDYIMGGPIGYSSTTTGTRHPVVIFIRPPDDPLCTSISCVLNGNSIGVSELQDAMRVLMEASVTISSDEIELEITVPGAVHAVFVDLPGIKDDSKSGADLTRSVVRTYVRSNPNDLYMLVKKASDDPANWSWQLREFILTEPPKGLGLKPKQTIVVGTRALAFLEAEKNDVSTHTQLLKRVHDRTVSDSNNNILPLYLLELFSLSIDEKEGFDFESKRLSMFTQINEASLAIKKILEESFKEGSPQVRKELFSYFDKDLYKRCVNTKFQSLLNEQLSTLERRLYRKRIDTQKKVVEAEDGVSDKGNFSLRELIKQYVRELLQIATELVTGNYNHGFFRNDGSGEDFLVRYGGNLEDNLREGHTLAVSLFKKPDLYDKKFIDVVLPPGSTEIPQNKSVRQPQQGWTVRVTVPHGNLFGTVQQGPTDSASGVCHVLFYTKGQQQKDNETAGGRDTAQVRTVEQHLLHPIVPISPYVKGLSGLPGGCAGVSAWARIYRHDGWVVLQQVTLKSFQKAEKSDETVAIVMISTATTTTADTHTHTHTHATAGHPNTHSAYC
eukprot:GHVR01107064.1.p1 GENE.GHVR01107064.1~~GHVR01107064.1.p1  ORF type:complete len:638 (+),score=198.73 GHVR01107064.1:66-1979(+)